MKLEADGSRPRSRPALAALLAALCVAGAGCTVAPPPRKFEPQMHNPQDVAVTREQARLRMRSLVHPMCGQIEQAADAIGASAADRDVQRSALQWKIDAVPALREALYEPDPATAAEDTLVLCYQMTDYFETGPGKQALGPAASAQAGAACRQMRDDFVKVLASGTYSGDVSKATAFAQAWAAEHPIRYSIADRPSTLTRAYERPAADELTPDQALGQVTTNMDDLNRKLELYSDQLFSQGRWEAERFKQELLSELQADQFVPLAQRALKSAEHVSATVDRLMPAMERALAVAQNAPALVASERETALKAMRDEIAGTTRFAHDERLAAQEQLGNERRAAMKDMYRTMDQQRIEFVGDMDQLAMRKIDYVIHRVTRLAIVAMAAVGVATLLGLFLARRLFARRQT